MNTLHKAKLNLVSRDWLIEQIEKLNKRAIKIGVPPLAYSLKTCKGEDGVLFEITIEGESPKYDGWNLLGVLSPINTDDGIVNLIRKIPGSNISPEIIEDVKTKVGYCDHCKKIRRRNDTYIVQKDSKYKIVGSNCIKDFLGHKNPKSLINHAEILMDLEQKVDRSANLDKESIYSKPCWSLDRFLQFTKTVMDKEGWVGRSKAEEYRKEATADIVLHLISSNPQYLHREERELIEQGNSLKDIEYIEKVIEWTTNIDHEYSDYLYNIRNIARSGYVEPKTAGLAASIIVAYERANNKKRKNKQNSISTHIGELGERKELKIHVLQIYPTETRYGTTGIHKIQDEEENELVWFASGNWLEVGESYTVKATIKEHKEFKGVKQTVLTRVKVVK